MKNKDFCLTEELAKSISDIITQKEANNYVCKVMEVTIREHMEKVFWSPIQFDTLGGGYNGLSGAEIKALDEKYGSYVWEKIPEKTLNYFVVMEKATFPETSKLQFDNASEASKVLETMFPICVECSTSFNEGVFSSKFPYLKEFFAELAISHKEAENETLYSFLSMYQKTLKIRKRCTK